MGSKLLGITPPKQNDIVLNSWLGENIDYGGLDVKLKDEVN